MVVNTTIGIPKKTSITNSSTLWREEKEQKTLKNSSYLRHKIVYEKKLDDYTSILKKEEMENFTR